MRISDWSSDVCSSDLLDDLARGARRKGVAAARQIGAGHRLRDRAPLGREGDVLRVDIVAIGRGRGRRGRARAVHAEHAEHVTDAVGHRSEEHTSELQSLMRISYAVFCLKKKKIEEAQHDDTADLM